MGAYVDTVLFSLDRERVAYQDNVALKSITLKIRRGETVALIGPSGAGKTTLLRTLYERAVDGVAFVHQHYALVPQLSVFHNVYIGRLDRHRVVVNLLNLIRPQKQVVSEIRPILGALGMADKIFEKVGALSGGEQQRTAVARAIYRGEDVLLADEPVSSVDPHQADQVMKLIVKNAETVVISLHAVEFALRFTKRIVGLQNGEIQFDSPTERVTQEMLTALYRGEQVKG